MATKTKPPVDPYEFRTAINLLRESATMLDYLLQRKRFKRYLAYNLVNRIDATLERAKTKPNIPPLLRRE